MNVFEYVAGWSDADYNLHVRCVQRRNAGIIRATGVTAEDILHDTIVSRSDYSLDLAGSNMGAFLMLCRARAVDAYRRLLRLGIDYLPEWDVVSVDDGLHDDDGFNELLVGLPDNWVQVLTLHYRHEYRYGEIGQALGMTAGAVKQCRNRALAELRTRFL